MLNLLNRLLIVSLLLLGISSQAMALDHEFSQDHWGANGDHYCLAQLASFDDCLAESSDICVLPFQSSNSLPLLAVVAPFSNFKFSPQAPRAPPIHPEV